MYNHSETINTILHAHHGDVVDIKINELWECNCMVLEDRPKEVGTFLSKTRDDNYPVIYKNDFKILIQMSKGNLTNVDIIKYVLIIVSCNLGKITEDGKFKPYRETILHMPWQNVEYGLYKYITDLCCKETNTTLPDYRINTTKMTKEYIISTYNNYINKLREEEDRGL